MTCKVSVVVGCMNRESFLLQSIKTWTHDEIDEIIIVDWNSNEPLYKKIKNIVSAKKIKLIRVIGPEKWILTSALNFGVKFAKNPLLLKLDCDSILHKNFFDKHPLEPDSKYFYSGNWRVARTENEKHLNGTTYLPTEKFREVGGYNEHIRTYGWDDTDLYDRLTPLIERRDFELNFISHIEHDNSIRSLSQDIRLEILKNMEVAKKFIWKADMSKIKYLCLDSKKKGNLEYEIYQPLNLNEHQLSDKNINECTLTAMKIVLNEHGYTWDMTKRKSFEAVSVLYYNRRRFKFYIEPKNGLGNKLRALASAAVLAKEQKYNLIVVWLPDMHCEAKFDDLFQSDELFYTSIPIPHSNDLCSINDPSHKSCQHNNKCPDSPPPSECLNSFSGLESGQNFATKRFDNGDVYVASACVVTGSSSKWRAECEWIKEHLHPILAIDRIINLNLNKYKFAKIIGLHIRMGQPVADCAYETNEGWTLKQKNALEKYRRDSNFIHFMVEMERVWAKKPERIFFLCADGAEIYEAFKNKYPRKFGKQIIFTPKTVYDRSTKQLRSALLDVILLSRCKYVLGSPWSSFTELVLRMGCPKVLTSGKDFGLTKYGLLCYPESYNIGDDIQSVAAEKFLPIVDYYISRDDQRETLYDHEGGERDIDEVLDGHKKIKVIENGWFDGRFTKFPFHKKIQPLFISFHLNETKDLFCDQKYKVIEHLARKDDGMLSTKKKIKYFRKHSPIGARDEETEAIMKKNNIKAYHSCCLTLTLGQWYELPKVREGIYVVDSHILEPELLKKLVPKRILKKATQISHGMTVIPPLVEKMEYARTLLEKYRTARLVITSRLHCALPCLAFHTPVLFLFSKMESDPRFGEIFRELLGDGVSLPPCWSWKNPVADPKKCELVDALVKKLNTTVREFV